MTLSMEQVIHHVQYNPFLGKTRQEYVNFHFSYFHVLYFTIFFFFIVNLELIFTKHLHRHLLRDYLWNRLVTTAKKAHFQGLASL